MDKKKKLSPNKIATTTYVNDIKQKDIGTIILIELKKISGKYEPTKISSNITI